jgi:hypothetical protein
MADQNPPRTPRPDPAEESRWTSLKDSLLPGLLRRTLETAAAADDAIRGVVGEIKLPKEAVAYIVEAADTTKKEVVRVAAREFREFLESANLTEELAKILTTLSFEIRTEIRFIPNDQALKPNVRSSVRLKSQDGEIDEPMRRDSRFIEGLDEMIRGVAGDFTDRLLRRKPVDDAESPSTSSATSVPGRAASPASAPTPGAGTPSAPSSTASEKTSRRSSRSRKT